MSGPNSSISARARCRSPARCRNPRRASRSRASCWPAMHGPGNPVFRRCMLRPSNHRFPTSGFGPTRFHSPQTREADNSLLWDRTSWIWPTHEMQSSPSWAPMTGAPARPTSRPLSPRPRHPWLALSVAGGPMTPGASFAQAGQTTGTLYMALDAEPRCSNERREFTRYIWTIWNPAAHVREGVRGDGRVVRPSRLGGDRAASSASVGLAPKDPLTAIWTKLARDLTSAFHLSPGGGVRATIPPLRGKERFFRSLTSASCSSHRSLPAARGTRSGR